MERWPFRISVMRFVGTLSRRASSAALISRASNSSAKCSPGWIDGNGIAMLLVIIYYLHVDRPWGTVRPFKANPPLNIDADAVLSFAASYESLETISG